MLIPGLSELKMYGRIHYPGMRPYFPGWRWLYKLQPIINQPVGLGFHIVRGVIDPADHRPWCDGVVDMWKYL